MQLSNNGVQVTQANDALTVAQQIFIATFGVSVNLDPSSPNGQTIQEIANAIMTGDTNLEYLVNSINPYLATGIQLDAICANLYLFRKPQTASLSVCLVTGTAGTIIPIGSQVANPSNNNIFTLINNNITIGTNGNGSGTFQAVVLGSSISVKPNTITSILTAVSGWSTVNNPCINPGDCVTGTEVETDASLRARFNVSKALASSGSYEAVLSALNNISSLGAFVLLENDLGIVQTIFGVPVNANTLYLICNNLSTGVLALRIAQTLFNYKSAGCGTQGTQIYPYAIPNTTPQQLINIKWDVPTAITLTFTLTFGTAQLGTLSQTIADLFNNIWVPTYTTLGVTVFASNFVKILGDNGIVNIKTLKLSTSAATTPVDFINTTVTQIITTPFSATNIIINVSVGA